MLLFLQSFMKGHLELYFLERLDLFLKYWPILSKMVIFS